MEKLRASLRNPSQDVSKTTTTKNMNRDVSIVLLWSVFSWHKYPASNISKHTKNRTPCRPHLVTRSVYLDVLPALWSVERFGDWQIPAMAGWVLSVRCGCARQGVKRLWSMNPVRLASLPFPIFVAEEAIMNDFMKHSERNSVCS